MAGMAFDRASNGGEFFTSVWKLSVRGRADYIDLDMTEAHFWGSDP